MEMNCRCRKKYQDDFKLQNVEENQHVQSDRNMMNSKGKAVGICSPCSLLSEDISIHSYSKNIKYRSDHASQHNSCAELHRMFID